MGKIRAIPAFVGENEKHPTGVGKIRAIPAFVGENEKHPHGCGEDGEKARINLALMETPPRVWGRRKVTKDVSHRSRNTPTGVGKTVGVAF